MKASDFLEIKEYLKKTLRLDTRSDLQGNQYIVLTLEDEIIDMLQLELEEKK